jgi:transposase
MKRYKVTLEAEERQQLHDLIAAGRAAARKLSHARILLKADAADGGPAWPDYRIADALEVSTATVERVRQRFVEQGLDAALDRKHRERPAREIKLDGRAEIAEKLEIHYTPKHGSWLNMAEIELSVLARQCLAQRIETKADLERHVAVWEEERNERGDQIKWRFTTADARIKLRRLYPTL